MSGFTLRQGEIVALVGPSGAGKSSLLHMAGLLEAPSSAVSYRRMRRPPHCRTAERTRLRRDTIGFVYQAHHLLPEFDALENVVLPQRIAGKSKSVADTEARKRLLTALGPLASSARMPSPVATLGWRAAARRDRARARQPPATFFWPMSQPAIPRSRTATWRGSKRSCAIVRRKELAALIATHNVELADQTMDRSARHLARKDRRKLIWTAASSGETNR